MKVEEKYISGNGLNVFYRTLGSGPPLILLHGGWATGKLNWAQHYSELAKHFTVISPDYRGHGRTNNPEASFGTCSRLAWDMIEFIEALKLGQMPLIMGHSFGALIGLHMSIFAPELIARQVLIGIHPFVGKSERFKQGIQEFFVTPDFTHPPSTWNYIRHHPLYSLALWLNHEQTPWLRLFHETWPMWVKPLELDQSDYDKIRCPTLVLNAADEKFGTIEEARELSRRIKGSEFVVLEGEDHMFVRNNPRILQSSTIPFLRGANVSPQSNDGVEQ